MSNSGGPSSSASPKRRRRWYQYGLRSLLLLMLVVCLACGWLGYVIKVYGGRAAALKRIAELGGTYEATPKGPAWVRWLIGEDYVEVTTVHLGDPGSVSRMEAALGAMMFNSPGGRIDPSDARMRVGLAPLTEDDCKQLARLSDLQKLTITHRTIDSAGLSHLRRLTGLVELVLSDVDFSQSKTALSVPRLRSMVITRPVFSPYLREADDPPKTLELQIDDASSLLLLETHNIRVNLRRLGGARQLSSLDIMLGDVTKEAQSDLAHLPSLELANLSGSRITAIPFAGSPGLVSLRLQGTKLTDEGLSPAANLPNLELLDLSETEVTGSGLVYLAGHERLRGLWLDRTPIEDRHLIHVRQLLKLDSLSLENTSVSDAGLQHLLGHPSLTSVSLYRTKVTHAAAMRVMHPTSPHEPPPGQAPQRNPLAP